MIEPVGETNGLELNVPSGRVRIDGFLLRGAGDGVCTSGGSPTSDRAGIALLGGSGNVVSNNIFDGNERAAAWNTATTFDRNRVSSRFDGFFLCCGDGDGSTISDNAFLTGDYAAIVTVPGGKADDLLVTRNTADGTVNFVVLFNTNGATVSDNVASGTTSSSVFLGGGNVDLAITGNDISGAATSDPATFAPAIGFSGGFGNPPESGVAVTRNILEGNERAVSIGSAAGRRLAWRVNFNRLDGNADAGVRNASATSVDATNNWWGCNEGPNQPGCSAATNLGAGSIDFDPWLVLRLAIGDSTLKRQQTATLTADLVHNSAGTDTSPLGTIPDGEGVSFATTSGTVNPSTAQTVAGRASTTLQAGTSKGNFNASASASVDDETVSVPFSVFDPSLAIADSPGVTEPDSGTTGMTFTVTLSQASASTVTVRYTTAAGSALSTSDYNATWGTLTFSPGQRTKTVTVQVRGDGSKEPNETLFVNIFNATNAGISDASGSGVIRNDD